MNILLSISYSHSNQTNTANEMLAMIVNIQPKDSGSGGGETRESVVYRLSDDMLDKLPQNYIAHEVCVDKLDGLLETAKFIGYSIGYADVVPFLLIDVGHC